MPYAPRPQKFPPKRVGNGSYRPGFSDKYGSGNVQFSQSNGLYGGNEGNYVTRPPSYASESPYIFENNRPSYNKVPSSQPHNNNKDVVQQHVHHHYVHSDDSNKEPKVIIKPVAIPVGSVGHLGAQSFTQQPSDIITAGGGDYSGLTTGGFKPMTGVYNLDNPDTIYGSQYGQNNGNKQMLPKPYPNNGFDDQKYGNSLGAYASNNNDFYKKELHVGVSSNNLFNQGPAKFGESNTYQENYHEAKAQGFECVCVNYDQCPSQEIIGRRDDLYLPIDPRNKGSDIAALSDEQLDNLNKTDSVESSKDVKVNTTEETKKVSKRETKEENEATKEIEPVSIELSFNSSYISNSFRNVTFIRPFLQPFTLLNSHKSKTSHPFSFPSNWGNIVCCKRDEDVLIYLPTPIATANKRATKQWALT